MPKSKSQKLDEYYQNRNHVVGSERGLLMKSSQQKHELKS